MARNSSSSASDILSFCHNLFLKLLVLELFFHYIHWQAKKSIEIQLRTSLPSSAVKSKGCSQTWLQIWSLYSFTASSFADFRYCYSILSVISKPLTYEYSVYGSPVHGQCLTTKFSYGNWATVSFPSLQPSECLAEDFYIRRFDDGFAPSRFSVYLPFF